MKFAICNETFQDWPFDRAFAFAAECGYTGLEIAPFTISTSVYDITATQRQSVRGLAESAGLEIIGLHWLLAKTAGLHLTSPDAAVRQRTAEYLRELARFCGELGGKLMVFGSPQQRSLPEGVSRADGMRYAAEVLETTLPALDEAGVTIALEPLTTAETNFMTTAAEAVELAQMVDSPRIQLHLDCKAMSGETASIPELIHRHHDRMVHFHANDPNRQGPGFGALDFRPIFTALREVNYQGWVSVEVFDYAPGVERLARESIEYMQRCCKEAGS
jgi:sugar phosphate isomerase/epimerase